MLLDGSGLHQEIQNRNKVEDERSIAKKVLLDPSTMRQILDTRLRR